MNGDGWRSRKFFGAILGQCMTFTALGLGWLEGGEFVTVTIAVLGVYTAGNVLEKRGQNGG